MTAIFGAAAPALVIRNERELFSVMNAEFANRPCWDDRGVNGRHGAGIITPRVIDGWLRSHGITGYVAHWNDLTRQIQLRHNREARACHGEPFQLYFEFRQDGWPLCPQCGEDELYSLDVPATKENIDGCYRCRWSAPIQEKTRLFCESVRVREVTE